MSSNSGTKAKRSYSVDGRNSKDKKIQKTLGVAWGANSRSSSRSSFRSAPFSDFGSYMAVKNRKLHEQFDAEASSSSHSGSSHGKPLFQGVSIFVDGYTIPSSQELRGFMLKHGGRFENYFSRHRVTHIICSNLPDSKIKNLRSFSGGLPVVKPTWVLDSVAANRLLNWTPYQLDQLASDPHNQPKLSSFFTVRTSPASDVAPTCVTGPGVLERGESFLEFENYEGANLLEGFGTTENIKHLEHMKQFPHESDIPVNVNCVEAMLEEPSCSRDNHSEEAETARNFTPDEYGNINESRSPLITCIEPDSVLRDSVDNPNINPSSSKAVEPSSHRHSTLSDPNFVENYFKNSRLHFIGTWRNRYRKRFPSLSNGFRCKSPSVSTVSQKSTVIHVDMDCFFVSVVIRNHPKLRDKPVAVCHSDNPRGTAEISSANYPARDHGVKAGMFVRDAKARCPHLIIFPYNFEAYEEVADQFYNILHKHCKKVQAVSCDEAFLDVTDASVEDYQLLASIIRKEIVDATGCTASAGIAGNMLMARLATRIAKPDGQCYIPPEKVDDLLHELPVKALPGIGHVLEEKLKRRQIRTCGQLRAISKESLQKDFGLKTGDMLWSYSRGIDNRLVGEIQASKSVGAEVNWGVRFSDLNDAQKFLVELSKEVALRLQGCGVQGRSFTLKIKKKKADAQEPIKYLGCGDCENLSHSVTVPVATDEPGVLQRITTQLFSSFHIDVKDIRGMGLQVSKLEEAYSANQGSERSSIRSFLLSTSVKSRDQPKIGHCFKIAHTDGPSNLRESSSRSSEASIAPDLSLPPLHELDVDVLKALPPKVVSEIDDMYGGKLKRFISESKIKGVTSENNILPCLHLQSDNEVKEAANRDFLVNDSAKSSSSEEEENLTARVETKVTPASGERPSEMGIPCLIPGNTSLMPSSLSQVDTSVLQQLPEDLRTDILELLPAHRIPEAEEDISLNVKNQACESPSRDNLWVGNPPRWIDKFKASNCGILDMFAQLYFKAGSSCQLSCILQQAVSDSSSAWNVALEAWDIAASSLCELLVQYVDLNLETDIEEIYVCTQMLRRLSTRSKFFSQIYDVFVPHLQASVGEIYGGNLHFSSVG